MFDEWEASVAVRDASVAVTLEGKRPCDERAIRALHDACARLHTAIARSNLPAGDISLEVSLGARCATCISFERHSKLCGVFSELAHCQVDAEAGPTRILRHSSVPAWHIINTLALELDAASVPVDLANGAMLVHVLEIADFLRLQDTLERARQAVRRLMRVVAKGDQVKRAQRCEMTAFTQAIATLPESVAQALVHDEALPTLLSAQLPPCLVPSWFHACTDPAQPRSLVAYKAAATFDHLAAKLVGVTLAVPALTVRLRGFGCASPVPDSALDALAAFTRLRALTLELELGADSAQEEGRLPVPLMQLCHALPASLQCLQLQVSAPPGVALGGFGQRPSRSRISFGPPGAQSAAPLAPPPPPAPPPAAFGTMPGFIFGSDGVRPCAVQSTPAELAKSLAKLPRLQELMVPQALRACVGTGQFVDGDGPSALPRVKCRWQML